MKTELDKKFDKVNRDIIVCEVAIMLAPLLLILLFTL